MNPKAMSLKAKIRDLAKDRGISAQVILQNFMFECFLERISCSEYKDKFVIKGGLLIGAIVGLDIRSTMDLDMTIRAYPLDEKAISAAIKNICEICIDDNVEFRFTGVKPTRKDDPYGGFRIFLEAIYDTIIVPLSVDITSGDIITPDAIRYIFKGIFVDGKNIELWAYNVETVLAEKVETILRRSVFNTRSRDFYDVYILAKTQSYNKQVFRKALIATALHRNSAYKIEDSAELIAKIAASSELHSNWMKYCNEYPYASNIDYEEIISMLEDVLKAE